MHTEREKSSSFDSCVSARDGESQTMYKNELGERERERERERGILSVCVCMCVCHTLLKFNLLDNGKMCTFSIFVTSLHSRSLNYMAKVF